MASRETGKQMKLNICKTEPVKGFYTSYFHANFVHCHCIISGPNVLSANTHLKLPKTHRMKYYYMCSHYMEIVKKVSLCFKSFFFI